jgi:hypothetical protein
MTIFDLADAWYDKNEGSRGSYDRKKSIAIVVESGARYDTLPRTASIFLGFASFSNDIGKRIAKANLNPDGTISKLIPETDTTVGDWGDLSLVFKELRDAAPVA